MILPIDEKQKLKLANDKRTTKFREIWKSLINRTWCITNIHSRWV